jgi:hypothetical protein
MTEQPAVHCLDGRLLLWQRTAAWEAGRLRIMSACPIPLSVVNAECVFLLCYTSNRNRWRQRQIFLKGTVGGGGSK